MKTKSGRVTIKDVAREAGVSTALVSMVMNARVRPDGTLDCPVNPITAERVQMTIRKLNYMPSRAAVSMRAVRKRMIGVINPDMARHYFSEISRNIENIASAAGYTVLFGSSDDKAERVGDLILTFLADGVDGLLITPCMDCHAHIRRAIDLGVPVVLMTRDLPGQENVGRVLLDNEKGVRMALEHLYSNGYRKIEMISDPSGLSNLSHRENLYEQIMAEMGLSAYTRISRVSEENTDESLSALLSDAIDRGVEAILHPGASLGRKSFLALRQMKRRIPEDLAIMSFDGGDEYLLPTPSISQIQQSRKQTAEEAFKMLLEMAAGAPPRTVLLEPKFFEGGSTACVHPERLPGASKIKKVKTLFDLVVVGGGVAGISAALSAARQGLKVALIDERNVLGGSNSSEVRKGLTGRINIMPYPSLGYLLNEFGPAEGGDGKPAAVYEDDLKLAVVKREKNISYFPSCRVGRTIMDANMVKSVIVMDLVSYQEMEITGELFADCTGSGVFGRKFSAITLKKNDIADNVHHSDECVGLSVLKEPYALPFRCLYCREPLNLFLAGKSTGVGADIREVINPLRTQAMTGEVVGLAAALCHSESCLPRDIYTNRWKQLDALLTHGAGDTNVPYRQVYDL